MNGCESAGARGRSDAPTPTTAATPTSTSTVTTTPMPQVPGTDPGVGDCDVLVIGGGINGCGIARDLAGRGWRVTLCEQDDLASHTSSSSTKLIHGGLRYLEYYELDRKSVV